MIAHYFKGVQPHINIAEIAAEIAFLPGPPERALEIAKKFSNCKRVTAQREFVTYKGERAGKEVCATSTGVGCPSAAIVVEELANCGVKTFIRVGTTGAIQPDIELGEVIIPEAAVRDDGTTKEYLGDGDSAAVANPEVVAALRKSADEAAVRYRIGTVRTNDAFYGASDFKGVMASYQQLGIVSFDMEALFNRGLLKVGC